MPDFTRDSVFRPDASFNKVRFGEDAPILETELNELQDIQNHLRASLIRKLTTSGILGTGGWVDSDSPGKGEYGNGGSIANTIYFGPTDAIINGHEVNLMGSGGGKVQVTLPAKPGSGTRTDLVFLEVWFEEIGEESVVNRFGGKASGTIPNNLVDSRFEIETSRRVQLKWQYRTTSNVNFASYPKGLNDPTVRARGAKNADTILTFSQSEEDSNLFISGSGSSGDKTTLGTVDGFSYAIPVLKVTRNSTDDVVGQDAIEDLRPLIVLNISDYVSSTTKVYIGSSAPSGTDYLWVDTSS